MRRIIFASCLLAVPFVANAQTSGACTNGTLNGTYSLTLTGRALNSSNHRFTYLNSSRLCCWPFQFKSKTTGA